MTSRSDLPPFALLRAFEAAGRTGSFKDAARDLHVTASSISHQIRDLERLLGASLFVRRTRAVELTPVGERYFEAIRAAFQSLTLATDRARGSDGSRPLRIGMLPFTASEIFVPALGHLTEAMPGVEFEIESRIHLSDLRSDEDDRRLDAVIRYGEGGFEGLTAIELTRVSIVPIGSPDRLRCRPIREPADLVHHTLVLLKDRFQGWRLWGRAHGIDLPGPAETISFDHYPSAMRAVEQGLGLGLGLLPLIRAWVDDGRVAIALDAEVIVPESLHLVFAAGGDRQPQLEAVARELRGVLAEPAPAA